MSAPVMASPVDAYAHRFHPTRLVTKWHEFEQQVGLGAPARTTDEPLMPWLENFRAKYAGESVLDRGIGLVRSGVCLADLAAFSILQFGGGVRAETAALGLIQDDLEVLADVAPDMPVRDAIGWALSTDPSMLSTSEWHATVWEAWQSAGFGYGDWVYVAAGVSLADAVADRQGAAPMSRQDLLVMAALRDALVPA